MKDAIIINGITYKVEHSDVGGCLWCDLELACDKHNDCLLDWFDANDRGNYFKRVTEE